MPGFDTFQTANNKGADQTAQMPRLVCACVIFKPRVDRFSRDEAHITGAKLNLLWTFLKYVNMQSDYFSYLSLLKFIDNFSLTAGLWEIVGNLEY